MTDFNGYAVFFFPNALEALGDTVAPYLQDSPGGQHILCRDIDLGGALTQLTLEGRTTEGREIDLELMFPTNMVRMVVSARTDPTFGFGPRAAVTAAAPQAPVVDDGAPGPAHAPEGAAPRTVPGHAARAARAAREAKAGAASPAATATAQAAKPSGRKAPKKAAAVEAPAGKTAKKPAKKKAAKKKAAKKKAAKTKAGKTKAGKTKAAKKSA